MHSATKGMLLFFFRKVMQGCNSRHTHTHNTRTHIDVLSAHEFTQFTLLELVIFEGDSSRSAHDYWASSKLLDSAYFLLHWPKCAHGNLSLCRCLCCCAWLGRVCGDTMKNYFFNFSGTGINLAAPSSITSVVEFFYRFRTCSETRDKRLDNLQKPLLASISISNGMNGGKNG